MKKIFVILLAVVSLCAVSCKDWLDINYNPNAVTSVEDGLILPTAEINVLTLYSFANVMGSYFSEQLATKPGGPNTYKLAAWDVKDGDIGATISDRIYQYSYIRVINNCKALREQAKANGAWGDYLAATIYRDFAYAYMVDMFGEIPYSEAENTAITAPKYDDGKDVYAGIIADLDEALSKVSASDAVCNNILFGGSSSATNWIQFGNALKFRLLMRERSVVDVKSALAAVVAENNFPTSDVQFASSIFSNEAGKDNPIYENYVRAAGDAKSGRTMDICGHLAIVSTMNSCNDARLAAKFNKSVKSGAYEGNFIDTQQSIEQTAGYINENSYSEPVLNYNTPVTLISVSEIQFLLAEYYSEVAKDAAKAKAAYEAAIDASFAQCGVDGASDIYGAGKTYAWNASKAAELIGIQKWVALAGVDGFESWCEMRRTGYPAFGPKTGKQIYNYWMEKSKAGSVPNNEALISAGYYKVGTIFTPANSNEIADNVYLGRFLYPESSRTTNSNVPTLKDKADKVFWAK